MPSPPPHVHLFSPKTLHDPAVGYSHVAEVTRGKVVFIAGQVSLDASGRLVGENDVRAQTQQIFENLSAAVKAAGGTFADVVKLNFYCVASVDGDALVSLREIRDRFVNTSAPPASTLVFVSRLARPQFLIEIEAVAAIAQSD